MEIKMKFEEFADCIFLLKKKIPQNANVVIDFRNVKRWINESLPQEVSMFDYDKNTNEFKVIFREAYDKNKQLYFEQSFNLIENSDLQTYLKDKM